MAASVNPQDGQARPVFLAFALPPAGAAGAVISQTISIVSGLPDSDARLHALYTASFSTAPPTIYVK